MTGSNFEHLNFDFASILLHESYYMYISFPVQFSDTVVNNSVFSLFG